MALPPSRQPSLPTFLPPVVFTSSSSSPSPSAAAAAVPIQGDNVTLSQRMLSALLGSLVTACLLTPLDVARVRMQVAHSGVSFSACKMYNGLMDVFSTECVRAHRSPCGCRTAALLASTRGLTAAVRVVAQHEGLRALWNGLAPSLALAMPSTVVYFSAYDELRLLLSHHLPLPLATCVGAATARGVVTFVCTPLEAIRTQAQARTVVDPTEAWYAPFAATYRRGTAAGLASLWRGVAITMWRDVPFSMLYWSGYENMKSMLCPPASKLHPPTWVSFISGAASGVVAAVLTHPFDVAKTRIQTVHLHSNCCESGHSPVCQGKVYGTFRAIFSQSGLRGFTVGIRPRIVKIAPSCAIMISCYEVGKYVFSKVLTW